MFIFIEAEIAKKLHGLRSQFGLEVRHMRNQKSGAAGGDHKRRWKYFECLSFLLDHVTVKNENTLTNLSCTQV